MTSDAVVLAVLGACLVLAAVNVIRAFAPARRPVAMFDHDLDAPFEGRSVSRFSRGRRR